MADDSAGRRGRVRWLWPVLAAAVLVLGGGAVVAWRSGVLSIGATAPRTSGTAGAPGTPTGVASPATSGTAAAGGTGTASGPPGAPGRPAPSPVVTPPVKRQAALWGTPSGASAVGLLAKLSVQPRQQSTGFTRALFGPAQPRTDVDGNGCPLRDDVLARDLDDVVWQPQDGPACVVLSGLLRDRYSGADVPFRATAPTAADITIERVVSLPDAWQKGAQAWTPAKRVAFANDPLNVIAARTDMVAQKDGADASVWLPPDVSYHCGYVARQIAVKAKYRVWVTPPERYAMSRVLLSCSTERTPTSSVPTEVAALPRGTLLSPTTSGAPKGP